MRTRTVTSRRSLRRLAAVVLGSVFIVCAWGGDVRGGPGPKEPDSDKAASGAREGGKHLGERRQLEVEIDFSGESGQTVTDENGTFYIRYSGGVSHEDKVYPPEYWGVFPLYYFGGTIGITVTVRNNGPRAKAKVLIRTEAYLLRTDGTSGYSLTAPREIELEVARGETKTIDASFIVFYTPQSESGLDRFLVKVIHPNEGGGSADGEPGLIAVVEGVFCPPEDTEDSGDEAF